MVKNGCNHCAGSRMCGIANNERESAVREVLVAIVIVVVIVVAVLQLWRYTDRRASEEAWATLAARRESLPERYDPALVASLPEPARRYFSYTIAPGTRLSAVVDLTMTGELSLGTKDAPAYQPMHARQILSAPAGLVWQLDAGTGLMRVVGSDGMMGDRSWTRFWLMGLIPLVRAEGPDHLRSAFGRVAAEAAFWSPAALLPQAGVSWSAVDSDTARAELSYRGMSQSVDIHVDADGRPLWVRIPRWTNANPEKEFRIQPFGGYLSDFRNVDGYRLPFRVEGGNFFGTEDYFPFYKAQIQEIRVRAGDDTDSS